MVISAWLLLFRRLVRRLISPGFVACMLICVGKAPGTRGLFCKLLFSLYKLWHLPISSQYFPPYPIQMAILNSLLTTVIALVAAVGSVPVVSQGSNILFEGRLPWDTELSDLDSYSTSPYNAEYVIGAGIYMRILFCDEGGRICG